MCRQENSWSLPCVPRCLKEICNKTNIVLRVYVFISEFLPFCSSVFNCPLYIKVTLKGNLGRSTSGIIWKVHSDSFRSQRCSPHNLTACFNLHIPSFVCWPSLWINCHRGNKIRVQVVKFRPTHTMRISKYTLTFCFSFLPPASLFCTLSLDEMWHLPPAVFLMPNVSSAKQPLRGTCWKKVAISYESSSVALYFFPPRHWQTCSLDSANGSTFNKHLLPPSLPA